ncbi:hypothetical protein V6N13_016490 [Hibiscus sabdariffa]|uniref:Peptidase C14 caspase domain-containing protein n=1 Tax=Hibiscus sabdariffa TaxID=183260 RepID=A0ABR2ALI1_9ROSI
MSKRAVLVGCNYDKTRFNQRGCINDVETMSSLIFNQFGFEMADVKVLTDAPKSKDLPTVSGHGTAVPTLGGDRFREEEAIVPCDFNIITDKDFKDLIKGLPGGVSFTILSDSTLSGALIDKRTQQIVLNSLEMEPNPLPPLTRVKSIDFNVICQKLSTSTIFVEQEKTISGLFNRLFGDDMSLKFNSGALNVFDIPQDKGTLMSGCQANETSFDTIPNGKPYGAFTDAVRQVIANHSDSDSASGATITNQQLVIEARQILRHNGFEQLPCLYCNDPNAKALFLGGFASNL